MLRGDRDTACQAVVWTWLGRCHFRRKDLGSAKKWCEQAYQVDLISGRPLWVAHDLDNLGNIAYVLCDLETAHDYYIKSFIIHEQIAPDSLELADILHNIGNLALRRSDVYTAHDYFTRALSIWESLAPASLFVAVGLQNLGRTAWIQGDLNSARTHYRRSLKICEQQAPESAEMSTILSDNGLVLWKLGDLEAAQDCFHWSLTIRQKIAPDSLHVASILANLGIICLDLGNIDASQSYTMAALSLREHTTPDSLDIAICLNNLGSVLLKRGQSEAARKHHARALNICERHSPRSGDAASSMIGLGNVAMNCGELVTAQNYYTSAFRVLENIAPGSIEGANALENLGRATFQQGFLRDAVNYFLQSVEIVERYRTQIVAPNARALLMAQHHRKYAGLIQTHLVGGDTASAFHTLERARARSFIELLAARGLDTSDAPSELLTEQEEMDRQRAQTYYQLSNFSGADSDAEKVAALHRTLRELERRQQELTASIQAASPHYASLQYPQPLTLAETQAALAPGTLLLSYFVDDDQTFLFAVTDTHAEAHALPVGREELAEWVRAFRQALDRSRLAYDPRQETELGRRLYALLVQPAQKAIRRAEHLLLCPDGPLHALPFAALVSNSRGRPSHLGAGKPIAQILSATTYAQTRATLSEATTRRLLAFGDPVYKEASDRDAAPPDSDTRSRLRPDPPSPTEELSLLQTRGLSLAPLPHTRAEVEGVARLFGDDATVYLGPQATRAAVLREAGDADLLHLACHAWFDPQVPLSSGLVLSQSGPDMGEDSGLLQAWEVFQSLRLSADLVVLSACQTGLGQEVRGEGLVGLARAFQYAGARSLVVSLWDVADESTSLFMQAFYGGLKEGLPKDAALRQGVLALQADPRWNSPCYWAAFVLIGDRE